MGLVGFHGGLAAILSAPLGTQLAAGYAPRLHSDIYRSSRRVRSAASHTMTARAGVWDADQGVWIGDKAAGHEGIVPSPLWIFG